MKYLLFSIALIACANEPISNTETALAVQTTNEPMESRSFYDLSATTIDGADFSFSALKGKRVLIVNVASKCGYTPQYEELQQLHERYGGENFVILGFPANDFGFQEPGNESQIKSFCSKNYGVSFQMMSKVKTNGSRGHEVYQWLCNKALNGVENARVSWNFNKFLIDENGNWVAHYESRMDPMSAEITNFAAGKKLL